MVCVRWPAGNVYGISSYVDSAWITTCLGPIPISLLPSNNQLDSPSDRLWVGIPGHQRHTQQQQQTLVIPEDDQHQMFTCRHFATPHSTQPLWYIDSVQLAIQRSLSSERWEALGRHGMHP